MKKFMFLALVIMLMTSRGIYAEESGGDDG